MTPTPTKRCTSFRGLDETTKPLPRNHTIDRETAYNRASASVGGTDLTR